ncbi:hypothetical protein FQ087_14060 [Sporosarcina sp. ANT_H38]|uniref:hypothetical protein n=1 Tax=Sporosarcina sp. ANT_H38 TaxID=2597358 RepID=UPI0011F38B93|nr:hypothetical protein [Sporosarcina sp. ANT_H38]KAA0955718.1 hypothetical protein FQ087_14060 [Sporosarcina sp. ANT_H38]
MKNKPSIFSNVFKFVLLIATGVLLTFVLISYGVPKLVVFLIVLALYVSVSILWPFYIIYKAKSLRAIGRYISSNHRKPIFGYSYALANGDMRDVENALKRIMNTYKQQDMSDIYGANLALFQNNSKKLLEHADNISGQEYKDYYFGHAYVMNGNFDKASGFLAKLHTPWMIHSLKAYTALKQGNQSKFLQEADQSIKSTLGMQRYVLHHTMRRFKNGDF